MSKQYTWLILLLFSWMVTRAQPGGWVVNASQFQYGMTAVAKIRINGVPDNLLNNHLALFWHGQIRGYATPVKINGQAFYFLNIYSNVYKNDTLHFRAFLGADQKVYESTTTILFKQQLILGSIAAPLIIDLSLSERPLIYSLPLVKYAENTCSQVLDVQSSDNVNSEGNGLVYSIVGGADAGKFSIQPQTGILQWATGFTPDFEAPGDADGDNQYELRVRVKDAGNLQDEQDIKITVVKSIPLSPLVCPPNVVVNTSNDGLGNCNTTASGLAVPSPTLCASINLSYQLTGATSGSGTGEVPVSQLFEKGVTIIQYTRSGTNTEQCAFNVTVNDPEAPAISCPANTAVAAGPNCTANLLSYSTAASATDNCSANPAKTQIPAPGTVLNLGSQTTLTMKASDASGNTATCTFIVSVNDQTAPGIICPANTTVAAGVNCTASLASYTSLATAADNCTASPLKTQVPVAGTLINLGNQALIMTATDAAGNTASCTFTVSATDQSPPSIACPPNTTVAVGANCSASLASYVNAATAMDNCTASPVKTQSPVPGAILNLGSQTLTLTATDNAGLTSSCSFSVTATDQTPPTVICKDVILVTLNAAGTAGITTVDVFQSATDNCGIINQVSVTPGTFNCSNFGVNTATLLINDGHNNTATCTTSVKVTDNMAPTMLCKNLSVNLNALGQVSVTAAQINNGSFDNCSISQLSLNKTTFNCANLGANPVILTGTDPASNTAQCNALVTVLDGILPVAACKSATVQLNAAGTVTVLPATVNNNSSDNCSFTLTLTPNTFTCANVGTTTVTLKATDTGNNSATCTALLTVQDKVAPTAVCKNPTVFLNSNGQVTITAATINNGSSDACGIATMTINNSVFTCGDITAPVTVTLTVKDLYNNTATCQSQVMVKDNLAPVAVCENTTVQLNAQGKVTVYPATLASDSYDNCSVWSYSPATKLYTTANIGTNNLTITVKDFTGNAATCVSVVTVQAFNTSDFAQMPANRNGQEVANMQEVFDLNLFPNPTEGKSTLAFNLPARQYVKIRVFNMTGNSVLHQELMGEAGENQVLLRLENRVPGIYFVEVIAGELRCRKRLVIYVK